MNKHSGAELKSSLFTYILNPKEKGNKMLNTARDVLKNSLKSEDLKLALSGLNTLRQLEETHVRIEQTKLKNDWKTIENEEFFTIESVVNRINNGDSND